MTSRTKLQWVINGPQNTKISKEVQTKIRKQAMQAVVERRRQLRAQKDKVDGDDTREDIVCDARTAPKYNEKMKRGPPPVRCGDKRLLHQTKDDDAGPPLSMCRLDIRNGPTFNSFDIDAAASYILSRHPSRIPSISNPVRVPGVITYFAHLGRAHGYFPCLDDALQVLIAQVRATTNPGQGLPSTVIYSMYGRALKSLQAAVYHPEHWSRPEVLCSTDVLGFFEVGAPSGSMIRFTNQ